jgi:hypothetical protein
MESAIMFGVVLVQRIYPSVQFDVNIAQIAAD